MPGGDVWKGQDRLERIVDAANLTTSELAQRKLMSKKCLRDRTVLRVCCRDKLGVQRRVLRCRRFERPDKLRPGLLDGDGSERGAVLRGSGFTVGSDAVTFEDRSEKVPSCAFEAAENVKSGTPIRVGGLFSKRREQGLTENFAFKRFSPHVNDVCHEVNLRQGHIHNDDRDCSAVFCRTGTRMPSQLRTLRQPQRFQSRSLLPVTFAG